MRVVVCRVEGCPNKDVEFLWNYEEQKAQADAEGWTIGDYYCGGCSTVITDIRSVPDDYEPTRPPDPEG